MLCRSVIQSMKRKKIIEKAEGSIHIQLRARDSGINLYVFQLYPGVD